MECLRVDGLCGFCFRLFFQAGNKWREGCACYLHFVLFCFSVASRVGVLCRIFVAILVLFVLSNFICFIFFSSVFTAWFLLLFIYLAGLITDFSGFVYSIFLL